MFKQDKDDLCWKGNNMACVFDEDNIQLNIQFDNKYDAIKVPNILDSNKISVWIKL